MRPAPQTATAHAPAIRTDWSTACGTGRPATGAPMTVPRPAEDITVPTPSQDIAEPALRELAMLNAETALPTDPIDPMLPTEQIDSTDPALPMLRNESCEAMDHELDMAPA